jgi:DNA-binding NarL/FixJ family response regulator
MGGNVSEKLRVVLVDDHEVVRLGMLTLLEELEWVEVVAEADSADSAVEAAGRLEPDVMVMDIRMPGGSGIDACHTDDDLIFEALRAGASGYVLKQIGNRSLLDALSAVREGNALLDPGVTQRVITRMREHEKRREAEAFKDLSFRELQVLAEVAKGKSNKEIAEGMSLSSKTVRNHVSTILSKLSLSNRIEAATYAVRHHVDRIVSIGE